MKVLFTTNIPSPYRVDFFNELGKVCDLTVIFENTSAKDRDKKWKAEEFSSFKSVFLKGIRVGASEAFCPGIIKYIKDNSFDVIVIGMYSSPTGMYAIQYMKRHHISFVLSSDGGFISEDSKLKFKIKHNFISAASAWLSTGKVTTEYLCHYGAVKEKVYVYPFTSLRKNDCIKDVLTEEEKIEYKRKLGITEHTMVLSVGQFIYRKGYDILLKSAELIDRDIGIYIVGGKPTDEYLDLKKELKLDNVHFIDFMKKDELADYYKAADVFVLPTREDIWGLVINEAMAYGLPVISTDRCIAGLELIADGKNGYIVATENVEELALRTMQAIDNKKNFSENSLKLIQKYTIEEMSDVHYKVLNLVGGKDDK